MAHETKKVFISSTATDLKEFRKAATEAIKQIGMEPVLAEIADIAFEPATDIRSTILSEIDSADVIVLILGHRYGATYPETGKSWTELEYERARTKGKPVLAYLASDDVPWPASQIDVDRSKIEHFRHAVMTELFVRRFRSPTDLAASLVADLSRLITRTTPTKESKKPTTTKSVRILRLLLSSPGDVTEERERVAKAVFRFNQEAVEERGLFIKLVRWEDMAPQIGPGPQNSINNQIGTYDLFIGIMWNRFGTPTEIAASGTEEEFRLALTSWKAEMRPWITFYFCERPMNFTNKDQLDQKAKVLEFRSELSTLGVVRSFTYPDEFEDLVYRDLMRIVSLKDFQNLMK